MMSKSNSRVIDARSGYATCFEGDPHGPHTWFYTSEGGGHMLKPAYSDSDKRARRWNCPGVPVEKSEPTSRLVWQRVGVTEERCNLGHKHNVVTWRSKRIYDTGEKHTHENGYERLYLPVYRDRQGRLYYARQSYDYHAAVYWTTSGSPRDFWYGRPEPAFNSTVNKDILGRVI